MHPDGIGPGAPSPRHGSLAGPLSCPTPGEPVTGGAGTPPREEVPPSASPVAAAAPDGTTGNESQRSTAMTPPAAASTLRRRSSRPVSLGKGPPKPGVPALASPPPSALKGEDEQPPDRGDVMAVVAAVEGVTTSPPRVSQHETRSLDGRVLEISPPPKMVDALTSGILKVMPVPIASGVVSPPPGAPDTTGGGEGSQLRMASQQRENIKPGDAQGSPAPLPRGLTGELMRNVAALDVTRMSCDQVGTPATAGVQ